MTTTPADDDIDIDLIRPAETVPDDDSIALLRRDLIKLIRYIDVTREWIAQVEEMKASLENKVAMHHAAFMVGACPPNADLDKRGMSA